jgi:hypothetical protein
LLLVGVKISDHWGVLKPEIAAASLAKSPHWSEIFNKAAAQLTSASQSRRSSVPATPRRLLIETREIIRRAEPNRDADPTYVG